MACIENNKVNASSGWEFQVGVQDIFPSAVILVVVINLNM